MKKKICLYLCCLIITTNICHAQAYKYLYYFDKDFNVASKSKAVFLGKGLKEDGLLRLDYFVAGRNGMLMSEHFTDSTLQVLNGQSVVYHADGKISKKGNYVNNKKEGIWQSWDTLGLKTDSLFYMNDRPYTTANFGYNKMHKMDYSSITDSLADTLQVVAYNEKGELSSHVFFKGNKGTLTTYEAGKATVENLYTRQESEADFPGGTTGWIEYLQNNLNASVPVDNNAPRGMYQVFVKFIILKDGSVSDVTAETSLGYGMEKEVIRIIKNGPKWIPASQYGRKVNAYRRQPVTFAVIEK